MTYSDSIDDPLSGPFDAPSYSMSNTEISRMKHELPWG